ncbi:MAG TPA: hypothetical protein VFF49_02585 [Thermodesulfobacteriota bacterium]|nr:hypothetical protein [Thermodesulfobacteriota bacterium]
MQLDKLFEELLDRTDESSSGRKAEIPYNILAELLVISRFCEPSSELYIAEEFIKLQCGM